MKLTHLNPPDLPDWSALFSQVVIAEGSPLRIIAISGQVGVDRQQALSGDGGFAAQLDAAFGNLARALSAAGCSAADVVKLIIYVVGYTPEKAGALTETVRRHFGSGALPGVLSHRCPGAGPARVSGRGRGSRDCRRLPPLELSEWFA